MKPTFDRFDICEAFYAFACNWHGGQWTKEYAIFGRLHRMGFRPSNAIQGKGKKGLTENGQLIYRNLVHGFSKVRG